MDFNCNDLSAFVKISKYVGQRFDLVQAGGGNASVKNEAGIMLIKASGVGLSEVELDKGYGAIDCLKKVALDCLSKPSPRPSIETPMHVLLGKWVVHTHPLAVGMAVCRSDWKELLSNLFPAALLLDYCAPGFELAAALLRERDRTGFLPKVIFLQNHGLVVHGQEHDMVVDETEAIVIKLEKFLCVDLNKYKQTTRISALVQQQMSSFNGIAYVSEDVVLGTILKTRNDLFKMQPCCPDAFVYGGYEVVRLLSLDDSQAVTRYVDVYKTYPRVVMHQDDIFFLAPSVRKAQEAEAVFKAQVIMMFNTHEKIQPLALANLQFLEEMSSERYRQNC